MTTNANPLHRPAILGGLHDRPEPFRTTKDTPDEILMVRIGFGDGEAMHFLYDKYRRLVYSIGRRVLRDSSEAEDLVQDVFLALFRSARRYDPEKGRVINWILWLTYRRGINHWLTVRKFYLQKGSSARSNADCPQHHRALNRLSEITESDFLMTMNKGMKRLSFKERVTLSLVIFEGYTLPEVAGDLGISLGNATHYYYRGLEKFRAAVEPESKEVEASNVRPRCINES